MADRHPFGGQLSDWVFTKNADDIPVFAGGALLQLWNARDGGTQYTDLTLDAAGLSPVTALLSSDGSDGYQLGDIPVFYGPPGVTAMWVSADGGPRRVVAARDAADLSGQTATALAQHVTGQNPHGTTFAALADAAFPSNPSDGALVGYDADTNTYTLVSGTGLNPADFVKTVGGSEITIPAGNTTLAAQTIRVPAGDRTGAPDTFRVYWNAGTNSVPNWLEVFWLAPTGEPRAQASADNRVAMKVHRRSASATADMEQWCTETGTPLAWVTANGSVRAQNLSTTASFTRTGAVSAGVGKFVWFNTAPVPVTLARLIFWADTAGTGTSTFDVNLNGATLYPTGKPTLAANAQSSGIITAAFSVPSGGRVSIDVDVAGANLADLTCQLSFT